MNKEEKIKKMEKKYMGTDVLCRKCGKKFYPHWLLSSGRTITMSDEPCGGALSFKPEKKREQKP